MSAAAISGSGFDSSLSYSWTIALAGTITGAPSLGALGGEEFLTAGGAFSLGATETALYLNYSPTPVPEPAAFAVVGLAILATGIALRRRRCPRCNLG